jgi:hypothetical protein
MKKIFTLVLATGLITTAQAQFDVYKDNDFKKEQRHSSNKWDEDDRKLVALDIRFDRDDLYRNDRYASDRKRDMLVAKINREYDRRIQKVRNSFFLNRWEKQERIYFLEKQRQQELREVYFKYHNRNRGHGRRF